MVGAGTTIMLQLEHPVGDWQVAEIQGLYGPFVFSERLQQKIWLRGEFDSVHAVTEDGQPVRVGHPGRWNQQGGPDFRQARLTLGGVQVTGDVELHLHAGDWAAHGHATDPAYDGVVLHVVLFPPEPGERARRADGSPLPTLVLLPLLLHDLEEYAAEDAIERLADRGDWRATEELAKLPPDALRALMLGLAGGRWCQKLHFARRRLDRLGWTTACHQTALEILGYRFNRTPMLKIAMRVPPEQWRCDGPWLDALFESERTAWSLQGARPANHPRVRLRQYAAWIRAVPDWPARLERLGTGLPDLPTGHRSFCTPDWRKLCTLARLRERIAGEIVGGGVGGTRLDNLICDGFLPLMSARTARSRSGLWFHWYPGDLPPHLRTALRSLGLFAGRTQPACHGFAQGLIGWMLAHESGTGAGGPE